MNEDLRNEIIHRWGEGASQRTIARLLGLSRPTIKRVLAKHEAERRGEKAEPVRRPSLLDSYETVIRELVGRYPEITVTRLLEELRSRGFTGSYSILRERMRQLRPRAAHPRRPPRLCGYSYDHNWLITVS